VAELLVHARAIGMDYRVGDAHVVAVRDATFEIEEGSRIALVGPSGSGKTTLLHLVAALDEPTSGSIEWPALGPSRDLRPGRVAVAFQAPSLLPPLTVAENVALPLLLLDVSEDQADERAAELLARFGLSEVAGKLPEEISGGQSQRAALARALAGRPRLLLADEPTGQQDSGTAQEVLTTVLDAAAQEGIALLVATHDDRVARRLDTRWTIRAGVLDRGVIASSR